MLVTSGYMGLGGLVVETRRENKQIRSTPQYIFGGFSGLSISQYPPTCSVSKKCKVFSCSTCITIELRNTEYTVVYVEQYGLLRGGIQLFAFVVP